MSDSEAEALFTHKTGITIYVEDGMVHAVYTNLPEECDVQVELLDFDNARADMDDPGALDNARERLTAAEKELRQIY